jgi:hypothetical protein
MSEQGIRLADVLYDFCTEAARSEFGARIAALEQDVAAIREHLVVRVEPEAGRGLCPKCKGTGKYTGPGGKQGTWTCPACNGYGRATAPRFLLESDRA